jgi:simple sugar transport system ATP-binding protein
MTTTETDTLLEARDVSLAFGSVQALREVSLTLRPAEITALVGDNGAGKSTLVRCICGIHRPDAGQIVFDGGPVHFSSPQDAREAGIETVHQNLALHTAARPRTSPPGHRPALMFRTRPSP